MVSRGTWNSSQLKVHMCTRVEVKFGRCPAQQVKPWHRLSWVFSKRITFASFSKMCTTGVLMIQPHTRNWLQASRCRLCSVTTVLTRTRRTSSVTLSHSTVMKGTKPSRAQKLFQRSSCTGIVLPGMFIALCAPLTSAYKQNFGWASHALLLFVHSNKRVLVLWSPMQYSAPVFWIFDWFYESWKGTSIQGMWYTVVLSSRTKCCAGFLLYYFLSVAVYILNLWPQLITDMARPRTCTHCMDLESCRKALHAWVPSTEARTCFHAPSMASNTTMQATSRLWGVAFAYNVWVRWFTKNVFRCEVAFA